MHYWLSTRNCKIWSILAFCTAHNGDAINGATIKLIITCMYSDLFQPREGILLGQQTKNWLELVKLQVSRPDPPFRPSHICSIRVFTEIWYSLRERKETFLFCARGVSPWDVGWENRGWDCIAVVVVGHGRNPQPASLEANSMIKLGWFGDYLCVDCNKFSQTFHKITKT